MYMIFYDLSFTDSLKKMCSYILRLFSLCKITLNALKDKENQISVSVYYHPSVHISVKDNVRKVMEKQLQM